MDNERSPIFIGGAGRSGTTLLVRILNSHPNIYIAPETKIIPAIAGAYGRVISHTERLRKRFHVEEPAINKAFRQLIFALLEESFERSGKERVGEKMPNNVFFFEQLTRMFPDCQLLQIVRDGRDVVTSLLEQEWIDSNNQPVRITRDVEAAARYWKSAVTMGMRSLKQPQTDCHVVQYERLVEDPAAVSRGIIDFLSEPWSPDMLDLEIYDHAVGRWEKTLDAEQKDVIKEVAGDLLITLGYADDCNW